MQGSTDKSKRIPNTKVDQLNVSFINLLLTMPLTLVVMNFEYKKQLVGKQELESCILEKEANVNIFFFLFSLLALFLS